MLVLFLHEAQKYYYFPNISHGSMKKYGLFLVVLLWLTSCANRIIKVFLVAGESEQKQMAKDGPCNNFMNYAPDSAHPEYTPTRYIRVRFFIVRHDSNDQQFDLQKGKLYIDNLKVDI